MNTLSNLDDIKNTGRNSIDFGFSLERKGLTYADVYYRLNGAGITDYNDILTSSGELIQGEDGKYIGRKSFQCSDSGLRTASETALDCEVGNIQERLFCLDNIDFKPNPKATNKDVKSDADITSKQLDLIHIPTNAQVEFKVCYSKLYPNGDVFYYRHRNGKFRKFLEDGNILIIYFINYDRVAVITKKNLDKSVKIKKENEYSKNKYWDVVTVWKGLTDPYKMMREGNSEISNKVSKIVKYEQNK